VDERVIPPEENERIRTVRPSSDRPRERPCWPGRRLAGSFRPKPRTFSRSSHKDWTSPTWLPQRRAAEAGGSGTA